MSDVDEEATARNLLVTKTTKSTSLLRFGKLECHIDESNTIIKPFVFVPKEWEPLPENGAPIKQILKAVGLSIPEIGFSFSKGHNIDTHRLDKDGRSPKEGEARGNADVVERRVRAVIDGISDACSQTDSIYVMDQAFSFNRLGEIALESAARHEDCPALTFIDQSTLQYVDPSKPADDRDEAYFQKHTEPLATDSRRVAMGSVCSSVTKTDLKEVECNIPITTGVTSSERASFNVYGYGRVYPGPLHLFHHIVVFERLDMKNTYHRQLLDSIPVAVLAVGGTNPLMKAGISCITNAKPLFCFRGTGGTADVLADLVEYGTRLRQEFVEYGTAGKRFPKFQSPEEIAQFIEDRFPASLPDNMVSNVGYKDARALVQGFPDRFNPESTLVIDVSCRSNVLSLPEAGALNVEKLQDRITSVMSTVYDAAPELGGEESDLRLVKHAKILQQRLQASSVRYFRESTILVIIIRVLFILTACVSILSAIVPELDAPEAEDESSHTKSTRQSVYILGLLMPLLLTAVTTLYTTYRPMQKFAAFFWAAKRLESETFRFRARAGPYHAAKTSARGDGHRQKFSGMCEKVVQEAGTADVRAGVAKLVSDPLHGWADKVRADPEASEANINVTDTDLYKMSQDDYIAQRLLPQLAECQKKAPYLSRRLRFLQFFGIAGAVVCVALQSISRPLIVPIVLSLIGTCEFFVTYFQLETNLPAVNGTVVTLTRILVWWDGLSLIQQRMPASRDRLVDECEHALLMQHQGYAQGSLASLGKELGGSTDAKDDGKESSGGKDVAI